MPTKPRITLYEVESRGLYHEHWLAHSPVDAARRAFSHARECGLTLHWLSVSSMAQLEDATQGGLVYVVNDTRTFAVEHGRIRPGEGPRGATRTTQT